MGGESMKKLGILLAAIVGSALLPSASMAACQVQGTIPEVIVSSSSASIHVRPNSFGATTFVYFSTSVFLITAALNAQASHEHVFATGNATQCSTPSGGASSGGTLIGLDVSP
jgi:hypothetical protein